MFWRVLCLTLFLCIGVDEAASANVTHGSDHESSENLNHGGGHDGHSGEHEAHDYEALVFLFCGITLGTAVLLVTMHPKLHNLQFTVVMFVLGVCVALVADTGVDSGMLTRSFHTWIDMDPHLILFVFLPALLFGDAMAIDTHVAKRCAGQCLMLAGPGVVLGAGCTGLFLYYVLPWGWNLSTSLTVGSILAATDPVAVVGLLKQLGASASLTIAIQGESLLNDGTAVVLFTVAYKIASGEDYGVDKIVAFVFSAVFGAVLIGGIVGGIGLWLIHKSNDRLNHHSPIIQVCVTICCAYWSFLIAEGVFHVSGVLSTVTAALVMAHRMWPLLVAREAMLEIWHVVETIGNALVFFLAGAMTGMTLLHTVSLIDFAWLLAVYVAVTLIRFVMLIGFLPVLNRVGWHRLSLKDVFVMTWGGLRGMVGLAFAILVRSDLAGGQLNQKDGDRILFLVGGIAGLTLIVNAPTCPALVKGLGITQVPAGRMALMRNVAKQAQLETETVRSELMKNKASNVAHKVVKYCVGRLYDEVNHHIADKDDHSHEPDEPGSPSAKSSKSNASDMNSFAQKISDLLFHTEAAIPDADNLWKRFDESKQQLLSSGAVVPRFGFGAQLPEMQQMLKSQVVDPKQVLIVREVFLTAVTINYWEQLKHGKILHDSLNLLLNSSKLAMDEAQDRLSDWDILKSNMPALTSAERTWLPAIYPNADPDLEKGTGDGDSAKMQRASTIDTITSEHSTQGSRCQWLRRALARDSFQDQSRAFTIINAYIEAHNHAQKQIATFFGEGGDIDSPEEAFVIIESQINVFAAAAHTSLIEKKTQVKVNTMLTVHTLSETYREFLLNTVDTGILQADEASQILHPLQHEIAKLDKERRRLFKGKRGSDGPEEGRNLSIAEAAQIIQRWYLRTRVVRQVRRASTVLSSDGLRQVALPLGNPVFLRQISEESKDGGVKPSKCTNPMADDLDSVELDILDERCKDDESPCACDEEITL
eukprot:TRINITY_DN14649_c0_g1_i1.p1 TRINITY_DN14649_c0_g1~~TRINITY_DN14649_c0_g1_i1.p1  ORF type:complete len:987 (-),score=185.92 TRINITY_DN14649_c0_g1_i1:67-3027(-)